MHQDLESTFWDYKDAHKQLTRQIEDVGELGGPLQFERMPELAPWEELREWWRGEMRFRQHSGSASQWLRGCASRTKRYIARGSSLLPDISRSGEQRRRMTHRNPVRIPD